ncbi:hypothetical protein BDZ89DRAFT_1129542 [Hymenopellis radicata]|nr:hypothetical protein BDZ89DRAFT_1129542 [Hymenopellis radicata]
MTMKGAVVLTEVRHVGRHLGVAIVSARPAPIWILIPPHLTHLNMWQTLEPGSRLPENNWRKMFAACPALTHLMFDAMTWPQFLDGITQFGKVVLSMAPRTLNVLVVELLSRDVPVNAVQTDLERMDDERLVVISRNSTFVDQVPNMVFCREAVLASFRGEGRGGMDVWDVACKEVDRRRARRRADNNSS